MLVVGKCATNPQENRQVVFSLDTAEEVADFPLFLGCRAIFTLLPKATGSKTTGCLFLGSWDCPSRSLYLLQNATANHKVDGAFVFIWQQQQLSRQTFLHFINSSNIWVANATGNSSSPRRGCQSSDFPASLFFRPILLAVYRLSTRLQQWKIETGSETGKTRGAEHDRSR